MVDKDFATTWRTSDYADRIVANAQSENGVELNIGSICGHDSEEMSMTLIGFEDDECTVILECIDGRILRFSAREVCDVNRVRRSCLIEVLETDYLSVN